LSPKGEFWERSSAQALFAVNRSSLSIWQISTSYECGTPPFPFRLERYQIENPIKIPPISVHKAGAKIIIPAPIRANLLAIPRTDFKYPMNPAEMKTRAKAARARLNITPNGDPMRTKLGS
jgi:hypothetical protein